MCFFFLLSFFENQIESYQNIIGYSKVCFIGSQRNLEFLILNLVEAINIYINLVFCSSNPVLLMYKVLCPGVFVCGGD